MIEDLAYAEPSQQKLQNDIKHQKLVEKLDLASDSDGSIGAKIHKIFIGNSPKAQNIKQMITLAASSDCPILITGSSGCGKEVTAKAVHAISSRRDKPLISINCGAIPNELIEAELFGHRKGSFTGAYQDHIGLFEQANGGTLFLDEIGDMPLNLQVRLLRILEDGLVRSIGGKTEKQVDVRIIAATNQEIALAIARGAFREDLYYRLSVLSIDIPTLKERSSDIHALTEHFVKQASNDKKVNISKAGWNMLCHHSWPGNIRELRNWVSRVLLFNDAGQIIDAERVKLLIDMGNPKQIKSDIINQDNITNKTNIYYRKTQTESGFNLREYLNNEEKRYMRIALRNSNGVVQNAAIAVGMKRTTFVEKMKRYHMQGKV